MISRVDQKRQTRAQILAAARRAVARQGLAATTARDVAAAAGVAVGTVFLHFPTMALLSETILDDTVAGALAAAAKDRPEGLIDRLVHVAAALYDAYGTEPELARQVIAGSLFESSSGSPSQARMAEFGEWVGAQVTAAVQRGEIAPIHPRHAFLSYFALYFGGLVAGLRGELDRDGQLAFVRESLRRLFGTTED